MDDGPVFFHRRHHHPLQRIERKKCFLLNSTARFTGGKAEGFGSETKIIGDATESGLVRFAAFRLLGNEEVEAFRDQHPKVSRWVSLRLNKAVQICLVLYARRAHTVHRHIGRGCDIQGTFDTLSGVLTASSSSSCASTCVLRQLPIAFLHLTVSVRIHCARGTSDTR